MRHTLSGGLCRRSEDRRECSLPSSSLLLLLLNADFDDDIRLNLLSRCSSSVSRRECSEDVQAEEMRVVVVVVVVVVVAGIATGERGAL
jgi:hypothetical protein